MLLKLTGGIATQRGAFEPGDVVDWKPDDDAKRLVDAGHARKATADEAKSDRVNTYTSPPKRPEDKWPPPAPKRKDRGAIAKD